MRTTTNAWTGRRVGGAMLATMLVLGCAGDPDSEAVASARAVDHATSYAHRVLRAGFDATIADEDHHDRLLLTHVASLDAIDAALADQMETLEDTPPGATATALRDSIRSRLRRIDAAHAAVEAALHARPTHEAVRVALATLPAMLAKLREQVGN